MCAVRCIGQHGIMLRPVPPHSSWEGGAAWDPQRKLHEASREAGSRLDMRGWEAPVAASGSSSLDDEFRAHVVGTSAAGHRERSDVGSLYAQALQQWRYGETDHARRRPPATCMPPPPAHDQLWHWAMAGTGVGTVPVAQVIRQDVTGPWHSLPQPQVVRDPSVPTGRVHATPPEPEADARVAAARRRENASALLRELREQGRGGRSVAQVLRSQREG